jgi:ABC-type sugar transport system ATPase subunit
MVFQNYALYPHMKVRDNMAFSLMLAKRPRAEVDERVNKAAGILGLTELLGRYPRQLSGGQRQRVAMGRAIVRDPQVFLFDEPLSNLDAALRVATRIEIAKLHERMAGTTMIYVTHDQVEAMTLADRIVVLNFGRVEQVGAPMQLYNRPANLFVAKFIGSPSMNTIPCVVEKGGADARVKPQHGAAIAVSAHIPDAATGKKGTFGIRPEDIQVSHAGADAIFTGTVDIVEHLGEMTLLYVDCGNAEETIVVKIEGESSIKRGDKVSLSAPIDRLHVFDENGIAYPRK